MEIYNNQHNAYFNEFVFQQTAREVNHGRVERGQPELTMAEIYQIHGRWKDGLSRRDIDVPEGKTVISQARRVDMANVLNQVFNETNGGPVFTQENLGEKYDLHLERFRSLTGWGARPGQVPVLPLSPYDDRFYGRETFMSNDGNMLYALQSDLEEGGVVTDASFENTELSLYHMRANRRMNYVGDVMTETDIARRTASASLPFDGPFTAPQAPQPSLPFDVPEMPGVQPQAAPQAPAAPVNIVYPTYPDPSYSQYLDEYMFHRTLSGISDARQYRGESVITTTQARALHADWKRELEQIQPADIPEGMTAVQVAMERSLSGVNNGNPVFDGPRQALYAAQVREFIDLTGWDGSGTDKNGTVLPLSPYDDRFAMRSTFLRNGSSMLYLRDSDVKAINGGASAADYLTGPGLTRAGDRIQLQTMNTDGPRARFRSVGQLTSGDDVSGLSRLMPFMSERDYRAVADWVNAPSQRNPAQAMSPAALDRSVAILEHLQEKGWPYKIERDENEGQIRASLLGRKISVRLMDVRSEEHYTGRTYSDGSILYYRTSAKLPGTNTAVPYQNLSAEDSIRLVDFAMGEQVYRNDTGKPVGEWHSHRRSGYEYQDAYHVKDGHFSAVVDVFRGYRDPQTGATVPPDPEQKVFLYVKNKTRAAVTNMYSDEVASAFLESAVRTARENFADHVDLEGLIQLAAANEANGEAKTPEFSGDAGIRALQQGYWEVLTGEAESLLRPGFDRDDYSEADVLEKPEMIYGGSPIEICRRHMEENMDYVIGTFEPNDEGKRFDPVTVSSYMTSAYGVYRNSDDIVEALKKLEIDPDELRGSDFYNNTIKDKMVTFDASTAQRMSDIPDPFVQRMYQVVRNTLSETGCSPVRDNILMDANGIVKYSANRVDGESLPRPRSGRKETTPITGYIGQIFVPGENGMVETKFAGSDNYLFVPGYSAHVVPQKPGEDLSMEERTRLRGYEQIMAQAVAQQIRDDVIGSPKMRGELGTTTSLNGTYRRVYDSRHPLDFLEQSEKDGMSKEWVDAIIKTEAGRVRYGNEYKEATANAVYQASVGGDYDDPANDNFQNVFDLVGRQNMGVIGDTSRGFFDATYTGTATNQGIVRFLVEGAKVDADGRIIPSDDLDARCPLSAMAGDYEKFDASDRRMMTCSNLLQASAVAQDVHVAQMTLQGWTFDDGYVVSKGFAENNPIRGAENQYRGLMKGDKISDMHGNKGVISLVVDPNMDPDEAKKQGLDKVVKLFHDNPDLDVVGAPFYGVSRFNAGAARELMDGDVQDLKLPDGAVKPGAISTERVIITHLPVDEKTHIYGEDDVAKGKGRKASAQLAWALTSKGCEKVMNECFGPNSGAWSNARELMLAMGMDMSETGELRLHYEPHRTGERDANGQPTREDRNVFKMPELEMKQKTRTIKGQSTVTTELDVTGMKKKFGDVIARSGGFLEIPFPLQYQAGDREYWRNMDLLPPDKRGDPSKPGYAMPILSSHLRSGQEFEDGTSSVHDYTNQYLRIYECALQYRHLQNDGKPGLTDEKRREEMQSIQDKAQAEYNKITRDLEARKFSGKHNIFRDDLMSSRMPHSATAVWTADPRLNIDQLGMGKAMADSLGVKDGEYVLTWRDPVLRDGGVRYQEVKIDESLTGVSINPVMDKSYDGDFDGDSIGVCRLQTEAARREAMEKLSVGANLLDYAAKDPKTGEYSLYMNLGLDLASVGYENPDLAKKLADIQTEVNGFESAGLSPKELREARQGAVQELSNTVHDMFDKAMGTDTLSFSSTEEHFKSVEHMVVNGSKGSYGKLADYAHYFGAEYQRVDASIDPAQPIDMSTMVDHGHTLVTAAEIQATQEATDIKKDIGIPGKQSQNAMAVMRNYCPKAALEITYPATQALLQIKHDPEKGVITYAGLLGPAKDLWRGMKLEQAEGPNGQTWKKVYDDDGKPVRATREEFVDQFMDVYTSSHGLSVNINREFVEELSKHLVDKGTGMVLDIEGSAREKLAAPMDQLAYGGTVKTLQELAASGRSLAEGAWNEAFLPRNIKQNIINEEVGLVPTALTKSDTQVGRARPERVKNAPVTVGHRRMPNVGCLEEEAAASGPADGKGTGDFGE